MAASAETAFHRLLDAADHSRTIGKSAGREWFLAGGLKEDEGQVDQPGDAELEVESPAGHHVDAEVDQHRGDIERPPR